MDYTNVQSEERRAYFRILDNIGLRVSYHNTASSPEAPIKLYQQLPSEFHTLNQLRQLNEDLQPLLAQLQQTDPLYSEITRHLNHKIDLLGQLCMSQRLRKKFPIQSVSLSAGGLAFQYYQSIAAGQLLQLEIVLYSMLTAICCVARVIDCEPQHNSETHYKIRVEYVDIDEQDRDLLVKHILQAESEQLRDKRKTQKNHSA